MAGDAKREAAEKDLEAFLNLMVGSTCPVNREEKS